jgi:hypothetical protein
LYDVYVDVFFWIRFLGNIYMFVRIRFENASSMWIAY